MRRAAFLVGAVLVALAVVLALTWLSGGSSSTPPAHPITASASLSRQSLSFGDPLAARVDVVVDPAVIDPASVDVEPRFAPYRVVGTSRRVHSGRGVLISFRYSLECLTEGCVTESLAERRFLPARIAYRTTGGQLDRQVLQWPPYRLVSRLTSADKNDPTAHLRVDDSLPPVSFRLGPGTLQALLAAAAGALVLAATVLVALMLPRRRARRGAQASPLEQALALVRASCSNGYPAERRKALGRLARELSSSGRADLAQAAFWLAWSAQPPSAEVAARFANDVEGAL